MGRHWVTIRAEFDLTDIEELGVDAFSPTNQLLATPMSHMATFENAVAGRVGEVATKAWTAAGLSPTVVVPTYSNDLRPPD